MFEICRYASQMRSERRHHGPTEAVDFIPKSDFPATLPVKISELDGAKLRGFTAIFSTNWICGAEVDLLGKPWRTTRHGLLSTMAPWFVQCLLQLVEMHARILHTGCDSLG